MSLRGDTSAEPLAPLQQRWHTWSKLKPCTGSLCVFLALLAEAAAAEMQSRVTFLIVKVIKTMNYKRF